MLLFLHAIGCVYLLHRQSRKFIGMQALTKTKPTPENFSDAIDFKLGRGMGGNAYITFETGDGQAFDIRYGSQGTLLDYFKTHRQENQSFRLVLLASDNYILMHENKCLIWNEEARQFIKMTCRGMDDTTIDLYYMVSWRVSTGERTPPDDDNTDFVDMVRHHRHANSEIEHGRTVSPRHYALSPGKHIHIKKPLFIEEHGSIDESQVEPADPSRSYKRRHQILSDASVEEYEPVEESQIILKAPGRSYKRRRQILSDAPEDLLGSHMHIHTRKMHAHQFDNDK